MEPIPFTKIKDIDIEILSHLNDDVLENLCQSNIYLNKLCHTTILWWKKITNKYTTFNINLGSDYLVYKKLYYKLKFKEYTDIVIWAYHNNKLDIIDWLLTEPDYIKFVIKTLQKIFSANNAAKTYINKTMALDKMFIFVYNHRFYVLSSALLSDAIKSKLVEFQNDDMYGEKAKLYYDLIFPGTTYF